MMKTLKSLAIVAAMIAVGSAAAVAQNGPATGGQQPVAGGAAGGPKLGTTPSPHKFRHHKMYMSTTPQKHKHMKTAPAPQG
jgi:hypothetical protein